MNLKNKKSIAICSVIIVIALLLGGVSGFFFGLSAVNDKSNHSDEMGCVKNNIDETIDYSEYPFTDISWVRKAEHDIETIRFASDGSFVYYCSCGNPVNDSDLNEGYTYDDKTKTIIVKYIETTEETVSTIRIEHCDDEHIKLDFNGEIREFVIGLS